MKTRILIIIFLSTTIFVDAQTVETIAGPNPRINNGLVVKDNGDVFASDLFGSGFNGTRIYRITSNGNGELFADNLSQPAGLVFDDWGILYVAEFTSGEISQIDEMGTVTTWMTGLSQPADLVFDSDGNLYVTNYGNGSISRITSQGELSTLTSGLSQPVGLAIDGNDYLYAANLDDGKIYKIDLEGTKSVLATIDDTPIGFLTFSQNQLYVTSTGGHKIYRVSLDGTVNEFAGTGISGTMDGEASTAQFTNPDGIAASLSGDTLYVSENNSNLLRRIILNSITGLNEITPQENELEHIHVFPNPANDFMTAQFQLNIDSQVELSVFSSTGDHIKTIISADLAKGDYTYIISIVDLLTGVYYFQFKSEQSCNYYPFSII